jgi:hypothetical protein
VIFDAPSYENWIGLYEGSDRDDTK